MLQSVLNNAADLKKLADEFSDKKLQRSLLDINLSLLDINLELLKQIVDVLQQFDMATQMLSTDGTPSLHLVYPTKVQLIKTMQVKPGDGPVIIELHNQYHISHCITC